ncbi:unnamed protein product [Clonostachys rosea]|uniref:Uncharacterized protein n=1 Tax=Bionectria ochroleuca TaxID=29856 RepID=A0ABY6TPB9_BIOOC|nr:unnamed protein product [Clonostachys rosea]
MVGWPHTGRFHQDEDITTANKGPTSAGYVISDGADTSAPAPAPDPAPGLIIGNTADVAEAGQDKTKHGKEMK